MGMRLILSLYVIFINNFCDVFRAFQPVTTYSSSWSRTRRHLGYRQANWYVLFIFTHSFIAFCVLICGASINIIEPYVKMHLLERFFPGDEAKYVASTYFEPYYDRLKFKEAFNTEEKIFVRKIFWIYTCNWANILFILRNTRNLYQQILMLPKLGRTV